MSLSYMSDQEAATYELLLATESCLGGEELSRPVRDYLSRTDVLGRVGMESFSMEEAVDTEELRRHASAALAARAAKFDAQMSGVEDELDETDRSLGEKLKDPNTKLLVSSTVIASVVGAIATGTELVRVIANDVMVKKEAASMKEAAERIAELKKKLPHLEMRSATRIKIDEAIKNQYMKAKTLVRGALIKLKAIKPQSAPEPVKLPTTAWGRASIGRRTMAISLTFAAYTALAFIMTRILLAAYRWLNKQLTKA